jgi:hypothetical protein
MTDRQQTHREAAATYFESTVPRFYTHESKRAVYAKVYRSRLDFALSLIDRLRLTPGSRCLDV